MNGWPNELRLIVVIAINVLVLVSTHRFVSRWTGRKGWSAAMDTLLADYLVQYISVALPGVLGILSIYSMLGIAVILSGAMVFSAKTNREAMSEPVHPAVGHGALFLIGFFICLIFTAGASSFVGDDALMYHLPTPAIWFKHHEITLFTTWFSNPANSYSPLAVETFIAWLLGPVGNDLLAHFVQIPALLLIYFACVELLIPLGVAPAVAVLVSIAAILSRPFVSQSILVKDDIFVASFFVVLLAGCHRDRLLDRLGAWRIGVAAGLFFATKYTALQSAPLLLLAIDAPFRAGWRWRQWLIAIGAAIVIAGPWYLRNAIITDNPLYPVPLGIAGKQLLPGLFFPSPSNTLHTFSGIWNMLASGYQGLSSALTILTLAGAIASIIIAGKRLREPVMRIIVIGPVVGMLLFVLFSHAPELRYAYPSLLLLFLACALPIARIPILAVAMAILFALLNIDHGFEDRDFVIHFTVGGLGAAIVGTVFRKWILTILHRNLRAAIASCLLGLLISTGWIYVYWNAVVAEAAQNFTISLFDAYPEFTPAWKAALETAPPYSTIAYTNIALVRPLMGFDYNHDIVYIPTRAEVNHIHDLPNGNQHISEPQFRSFMADLLMTQPNREQWLLRLHASAATCVVIGKPSYLPNPPELRFVREDPIRFQLVMENGTVAVFRIVR